MGRVVCRRAGSGKGVGAASVWGACLADGGYFLWFATIKRAFSSCQSAESRNLNKGRR